MILPCLPSSQIIFSLISVPYDLVHEMEEPEGNAQLIAGGVDVALVIGANDTVRLVFFFLFLLNCRCQVNPAAEVSPAFVSFV